MTRSTLIICLLASTSACGNSSKGDDSSTGGALSATASQGTVDQGTAGQGTGQGTGVQGTGDQGTDAQGADAQGSVPTGGGSSAGATSGGNASGGPTGSNASGGVNPEGAGGAGGAPTSNDTDDATSENSSGSDDAMPENSAGSDDATPEDGAGSDDASGGTGGATADDASEDAGTGSDEPGGAGGVGGETGGGGEGGEGAADDDGDLPISSCNGDAWPTANPTSAGPFQVAADRNVGPLAGVVPDPIYGDEQQRYNVYRPNNLADSGYCHPILIWANGYRDNPEQNPPDCVVDSGSNQWCGQYSPMLNHLASHGFVVVASLSTATAEGDPLPTTAGLDWILEQAEDPSSPYYQRLDTTKIGQLGHSYGGMSTCMTASDPRYSALATICGTRALEGVHTPMLFFCGGQDSTVNCSGVRDTFSTVTDQPAFFINELGADHGSWVYEGAGGVSLSSAAAWFRAHLMDDTESRKFFYGAGCTFCSDNRVEIEQNSLMTQ